MGRWLLRLTAALLATLLAPSAAPAAKYGEVEVTIRSEPREAATHGYGEVEFLVVNREPQGSRDVRITYPHYSYGYGGDYLRSVSRTVTVEAGKSARVALAYPERLLAGGSGATVSIDGREQEQPLQIHTSSPARGYSYGSSPGRGSQFLIFYSKTVDTRFPDWAFMASGGAREAMVRADLDANEWSANWLAYTRYDGVVVTSYDLGAMPAEVKNALAQYVECGGSLFVLGRNPPLPGQWKRQREERRGVSVARPGFGQCTTIDQTDLSASWPALSGVIESWNLTASPLRHVREPAEANRAFPVVDDLGTPVKGLLGLMFVFVVVIGPVNMIVLARKRRKLWLFWTVPLISFATCLLVVGYMAATEGWSGRSRVEGFTVLDENSRRASTLGWAGFYTPLLPRGGLHFSPETEVSYQNGDESSPYSYSSSRRRSSGSPLSIDWTRDQHFTSGWLTPRVPSHFALRKSELRRERVTITKAGGVPEAVNGLGADLSEFWYRDEAGRFFRAGAIPAGGRATLEPAAPPAINSWGEPKSLRQLYTGDWSGMHDWLRLKGAALLAPRTYLAVVEGAPFLDDPMPGASVRRARSVVYGILKEGGDGG